jgi:hypothetical protein
MVYKELFENVLQGPWELASNNIDYKIVDKILYLCPTNSKSDWKINFNFPIKAYKNQDIKWRAHGGYVKAYKEAKDKLFDEIINNDVHIIIGYSFGAAIATLLHEDIVYNLPNYKIETVVFGSPRVIWVPNKKLLYRWNNFHNIQVSGDLVTKVPFYLFGFRHIGIIQKLLKHYFIWWAFHKPEYYIQGLKEWEN